MRPECIALYNKQMGGVDKLDFLASLYRSYIRSKKWTVRLISHAFDIALINSWLKYKERAVVLGIPKKNILDLLKFRQNVAESLFFPSAAKKRGRPSSEDVEVQSSHSVSYEVRLIKSLRYEGLNHLPQHDTKKEPTRCKKEGCKDRTHIYCSKRKIHLCLMKNRDCFYVYHIK